MKHTVTTKILALPVLLFTALLITACSSSPQAKHDPWNSSDSQKAGAKKTQQEMSSETSK